MNLANATTKEQSDLAKLSTALTSLQRGFVAGASTVTTELEQLLESYQLHGDVSLASTYSKASTPRPNQ
jgi:hypothetical protein